MTKSISTTPGWDASPRQGYPQFQMQKGLHTPLSLKYIDPFPPSPIPRTVASAFSFDHQTKVVKLFVNLLKHVMDTMVT